MSYLEQAKDEAEESERSSNNGFDWEPIDVDFDEVPFIRTQPTTFVEGTVPEYEEGNPILRFPSPQYNEGRYDQGYPALVLDDPAVLVDEEQGTENTVVVYNEDENEVRVFNEDDEETEVIEGDVGVQYDGTLYRGEVMEELPDFDRAILAITVSGGRNIAKRLDVCGGVAADMDPDTGRANNGLIEYPTEDVANDEGEDEDGFSSRYARDPEVRDELLGTRLGLLHTRRSKVRPNYDGRAHWLSVFNMETDEPVKAVDDGRPRVSRTNEDGETWQNRTYLEWRYDEDMSVEGNGNSDSLPPKQREFVQKWVDNDMPTSERQIQEAVEEDDEQFEEEVDVDAIVSAVKAQS